MADKLVEINFNVLPITFNININFGRKREADLEKPRASEAPARQAEPIRPKLPPPPSFQVVFQPEIRLGQSSQRMPDFPVTYEWNEKSERYVPKSRDVPWYVLPFLERVKPRVQVRGDQYEIVVDRS